MINSLIAILEMEAYYNFLAEYLINKLFFPSGESEGLTPEELFGSRKYQRSVEVALC